MANRMRKQIGILGRTALALGLAALLWTPAISSAAEASVSKDKPNPAKEFPISGAVGVSTTLGQGSFVTGPQNRTSWSGGLSLQVSGSPTNGVTLLYLQDISKTLVDNFDDAFAARAKETFVSDPLVMVLWSPRVGGDEPELVLDKAKAAKAAKMAALNPMLASGGKGKPLALPGDIRVNFAGIFSAGLGRISRYRGQYGSAGLAVNLSRTFGKVMLAYRLRYNKQFHQYTNAVLDTAELDDAPIFRAGGAEDLGGGLVASSFQNTSFFFRNRLLVSWSISDAWTFQGMYRVTNAFTYYSAPLDERSGVFAKEGRGRSDTQLGMLSLNWTGGGWIVSGSTTTWSVPFSADNSTYRFPFWDFISASDNITTVSLSLTKPF